MTIERLRDWLQRELAGFQLAKVRYAYEAGSTQIGVGDTEDQKEKAVIIGWGSLNRPLMSCLCLVLLSA